MPVKITKTSTLRQFDKGVSLNIAATDVDDTVDTSTPHNLATGQLVDIIGNTGTTPAINGQAQAITVVSPTVFSIDGVDITVAGNADGTVTRFNTSFVAENTSFVYNYDEVGNTIEILHSGKVIQSRTLLTEYTDNTGAGFASFAAFITYVA